MTWLGCAACTSIANGRMEEYRHASKTDAQRRGKTKSIPANPDVQIQRMTQSSVTLHMSRQRMPSAFEQSETCVVAQLMCLHVTSQNDFVAFGPSPRSAPASISSYYGQFQQATGLYLAQGSHSYNLLLGTPAKKLGCSNDQFVTVHLNSHNSRYHFSFHLCTERIQQSSQ